MIITEEQIDEARRSTREALRNLPDMFTKTGIAREAGLPSQAVQQFVDKGSMSEKKIARVQAVLLKYGILENNKKTVKR